MSRNMTKPTKWLCAQRRLRSAWASAQSDQSLRCSHEEPWVLSYPLSTQQRLWSDWAEPRLIWVIAERTAILLVLSCHSSNGLGNSEVYTVWPSSFRGFLYLLVWAATWNNQQNECVPSEDSDQPGHLPSLISLRCALNGYLRTQAFIMRTAKTDQTEQMPRLIWVFAGCIVTLLVLSCCGSSSFRGFLYLLILLLPMNEAEYKVLSSFSSL